MKLYSLVLFIFLTSRCYLNYLLKFVIQLNVLLQDVLLVCLEWKLMMKLGSFYIIKSLFNWKKTMPIDNLN